MSARGRTRRRAFAAAAVVVAALAVAGCTASVPEPTAQPSGGPTEGRASPVVGDDAAEVAAIRSVVEQTMADRDIRAAIVRVMRGDDVVLSQAWGMSMAEVPASVDMHFRSGAMSIPQMSTVLFQLVEEGAVSLDDPLAGWLPDVPHADRVTLGQLAQMTSGYADYVHTDAFLDAFNADPFRQWQPEELAAFGTDQPLAYEPGTNWNYAHTDYVLLGLALEQIEGEPLADILAARILEPLGMTETADPGTPAILEPALHAYDGERREYFGVPDELPFIEDSTYWNPSWTLARGAIQNTDIADMATVIRAIGRGDLLEPASHALMIAPTLRGETTALEGCATCAEMGRYYTYGYGIVLSGDWLLQNPLFHGFGGVGAHLPEGDITIAVAVTYGDEALGPDAADAGNLANPLFSAIAGVVAPDADTRSFD